MDRLFQPLPEILHMHRQPERRAPAIVSLVFTLLSAVPVVLYVLVALQLGGNLEVCSAWVRGGTYLCFLLDTSVPTSML